MHHLGQTLKIYVIDLKDVYFGHMYSTKVPTFDWRTQPSRLMTYW
jgi:hypothetical protein